MTATTISTMAPTRSTQGARLKPTPQGPTANAQASAPSIGTMVASGATMGTINQKTHWSTTAATPGHSRSDFCRFGWSIWGMAISNPYVPQQSVCSGFQSRGEILSAASLEGTTG